MFKNVDHPLFSDISEQTHRPYPGHYTQLQYRIVGLCRYQHLAFKKNHQENQFFLLLPYLFLSKCFAFQNGSSKVIKCEPVVFIARILIPVLPWKEISSIN